MLKIYENIKKYRLSLGLTQTELAERVGYTDRSMIAKIESGKIDLSRNKVYDFAEALHTTPIVLMGLDEELKKEKHIKSVKIPVLGYVAAGLPIEAIEDIIDYEEIPEEMARSGEFFGLEIHGNSMYPRIFEGDVVIVKKQSTADSGDIVIALINGEDGICKQLYKYKDHIELRSFNPMYKPLVYSNEDIDSLPVTIMGKVVELRGKF